MSALAPTPARTGMLWLTWFGKEWRAQRGTLLAYLALACACLSGGLSLHSFDHRAAWDYRALALVLFVAMGILGVVAFAAPLTVRGEVLGKDDQLVRRLPGALPAASLGKLTFLLLVAVVLPALSLAAGQGFLAVRGLDLVALADLDSSVVGWRGPGFGRAAFLLAAGGVTLALTPWVMAVATWLPGGRMALGAVAVLIVLGELAVLAVLSASPGLGGAMAGSWLPWLAWLTPLGALVAHVSLVRGRRGGGAWRSARAGASVTLLGLLPPAAWLGAWARAYHWPRLDRIAHLQVDGVTPDGRFVVARGAEHASWYGMPMRLDLLHGTGVQLGGSDTLLTNEVLAPWIFRDGAPHRFWRAYGRDSVALHLLDAVTGARHAVDAGAPQLGLAAGVLAELAADLRASTPFRAPGGRRAWVAGDRLHIETGSGIDAMPWAGGGPLHAAGHGIVTLALQGPPLLFDLSRRTAVAPPSQQVHSGMCVGGLWLVREKSGSKLGAWQLLDPERGALAACDELQACDVVALWDDEEVVAVEHVSVPQTQRREHRLFTFRPRDHRVTPIALPAVPGSDSSGSTPRSNLAGWVATRMTSAYGMRDPGNRLWLTFRVDGAASPGTRAVLAVDSLTRAVVVVSLGEVEVLAFPDQGSVLLLEDHRRVVRLDYERTQRTVLFPRHERTGAELR